LPKEERNKERRKARKSPVLMFCSSTVGNSPETFAVKLLSYTPTHLHIIFKN